MRPVSKVSLIKQTACTTTGSSHNFPGDSGRRVHLAAPRVPERVLRRAGHALHHPRLLPLLPDQHRGRQRRRRRQPHGQPRRVLRSGERRGNVSFPIKDKYCTLSMVYKDPSIRTQSHLILKSTGPVIYQFSEKLRTT